jgi:hypothetical protein
MRLLLAALAFSASSAHAARPLVTDDARLVDPQGCQVETFYKHQRKFHEREFWVLPACNPWGRVELTLGGNWIDSTQPGDSRAVIAQAKTLLVPLQPNGAGFALTFGVARVSASQAARVANPYVNGIGSFSFLDDSVVLHANLGAVRDNQVHLTRGTWGLGAEILLVAPGLYAMVETYGQRLEKPTLHGGLRFWVVPNRVQIDSTIGSQHATPLDRRFGTFGLRLLW